MESAPSTPPILPSCLDCSSCGCLPHFKTPAESEHPTSSQQPISASLLRLPMPTMHGPQWHTLTETEKTGRGIDIRPENPTWINAQQERGDHYQRQNLQWKHGKPSATFRLERLPPPTPLTTTYSIEIGYMTTRLLNSIWCRVITKPRSQVVQKNRLLVSLKGIDFCIEPPLPQRTKQWFQGDSPRIETNFLVLLLLIARLVNAIVTTRIPNIILLCVSKIFCGSIPQLAMLPLTYIINILIL